MEAQVAGVRVQEGEQDVYQRDKDGCYTHWEGDSQEELNQMLDDISPAYLNISGCHMRTWEF